MEEINPMLMELGNMLSALQSLQSGQGLPRKLAEQIERQGRELNLPNDPQELKSRLKQEQRKMKANLKKLKSAAQKANSENGSSSEGSDSGDDYEVNAEIGSFLGAAALGNTGFCSMMLQRGVDVNARGPKNATALHVATQEDKSDIVNLLLSRGADVNAVDSDGDTPLIVAIIKKHRPLIRLLIERGTNLTLKNKKGFTAGDLAFIAEDLETLKLIEQRERSIQFDCKVHKESILSFAQKGSTQMIEYWLNNYPQTDDVTPCNLQYKDGRTIAFTAALNGSEELLALVDSLNADLDLPDSSNSSPLFCAAQNGYESIVKMLLDKGCDVNRVRDTGRTAIFSAIVNSHAHIVRILADAGAEINIKDKTGTCPLACSIVCGSQEIFDYLLLEKGADCSVIDENGNDLVLIAALYNRFNMLKQLHEHGLSLDATNNKDGETPLLSACQVSCPEMVEYLADQGCNLNVINKNGVTPVLRASFNNDLATVKILAKRNAHLDEPNKRGETAILVSAQKKSVPLVEYLHRKHCNISVIDKNGHTLAYYAATSSNMEMLHALIRHAAPLDRQDKKGNTPLIIAAVKPANLPMLQELVTQKCNVETKNNAGNTACSIAAKQGSLEVLQYLESIGEELVNVTKKGKTIIMQASKRNQVAVLRLIKASVTAMRDVDATCDLGRTAVHYAALGGHTEVVDFLSNEFKAETDTKDHQGNTPFMLAVQKKHKEVAEKLNDLGADVNIRNKDGENAVHLAVQAKSLELVKFLDQKGCYLDQEDRLGRTPLMLACTSKKMAIVNFLLSRNCFLKSFSKDGRQVIHAACESGKLQIVKRLIDLGVPVHATDSSGISTLMLAAQAGCSEIIDALISRKPQLIEMKDVYGKSALEYAIIWDRSKVINQLIDSGCSVDNKLNDGRTPLLLAIASTSKSADELVQTLMDRGCSIDSVTEDGLSAAHVACKFNKLQVLKILIEKGISIEGQTKSGDSCLTLAVPKGSVELIGLLVEAGLSKSHTNREGHSAVSLGYQRGDEDVMSKLLPVCDSDIAKVYANENTLLHLACEGGSKKLVENLIDRDVGLLQSKNSSSETPLHVACRGSKLELIDLLLQRGADFKAADDNGETPIFLAISAGNVDICKAILRKKTDLSMLNKDGVSAMAKAYHKGKKTIIRLLQAEEAPLFPEKLPSSFELFRTNLLGSRFSNLNELLNAGLSVDRLEKDWHLLHLGIETSRSEIIEELLNKGASVNVKDNRGNTPLLSAIMFGRIDVAQQILEKHPETRSDVNKEGDTVLHVAVKENKLSTLYWLLEKFEFEKNVKNKKGQTPLHIAALKGNVKMYELLVEKGFDCTVFVEDGLKKYRISHLAAMSCNTSLLKHLRDKGQLPIQFSRRTPSILEIISIEGQLKVLQRLCDETGQNYEHETFFGVRNLAFFWGHESLCRWMINRGVDLERPDQDGETPISMSVQGGNFHLCRELIEQNRCDLSVKTKHGVSLVQKAVVADHEPILRYLINRKASIEEADSDGDTPLLEAVNLKKPRLLLVLHSEYKCDLERSNRLNRNAAHLASIAGNVETLKYLKQHLPQQFFSASDLHCDTPLMLSVLHGKTDAFKFLVENFVLDVNHQNETKSTALHWAANKSNLIAICTLISKEASVDPVDKDGVTPLMLAVQAKSAECARALLVNKASLTAKNRYGDSALALMLHSDDNKMKDLGRELHEGSHTSTENRLTTIESLGYLTAESLHYYDHFPEQRPNEPEDEEEELEDAVEAPPRHPVPRQPTMSVVSRQSSVSQTSRAHVLEPSLRDRRGSSVRFEIGESVDGESIATAFTAHQSISTGSFVLKLDAQNADQKWLQLLQTAMNEIVIYFPKKAGQPSQPELGSLNLCEVADFKFAMAPRPALELTTDLPRERLSVCLDRARDQDRTYRCLDKEYSRCAVKQVLSGLVYLHSKGVTHGRLTLASIFITADNVLKMSDYGLVSQLAAHVSNSHRRYDPWTAPELRRDGSGSGASDNQKLATQEGDMWAFGCTLHEVLIGCPPESEAHGLSKDYLLRVFCAAQRPEIPVTLHSAERIFPSELAAVFKKVYLDSPGNRMEALPLLNSLTF